jgi:DNA-binding transcriptional regulator YdaS (Cro superfamily)
MTGDALRDALVTLGMRQRAFAARLGVSPNTVNRWIGGAVPVPRYAEAFIDVLLRDKQPQEPAQ